MGTTPIYGFPFLENSDPPNIPLDGSTSMTAVETQIARLDAALAPNPVEAFQAANDTTSSTTYVAGTTHGVAFVAPPGGSVYVTFSGWIGSNAVSGGVVVMAYMSDYVRTGSTVGSGSDVMTPQDDRGTFYFLTDTAAGYKYVSASKRHLVTGLTPGSSYNVTTVFRTTTGGASAGVNKRWILVEPVL